MSDRSAHQVPKHYQIRVQGQLDPNWSDWFSGLAIDHEVSGQGLSVTTLTGSVEDQSALRGTLQKLWDLNLVVQSVLLLSSHDTLLG